MLQVMGMGRLDCKDSLRDSEDGSEAGCTPSGRHYPAEVNAHIPVTVGSNCCIDSTISLFIRHQ
jgi:hypothetical protein